MHQPGGSKPGGHRCPGPTASCAQPSRVSPAARSWEMCRRCAGGACPGGAADPESGEGGRRWAPAGPAPAEAAPAEAAPAPAPAAHTTTAPPPPSCAPRASELLVLHMRPALPMPPAPPGPSRSDFPWWRSLPDLRSSTNAAGCAASAAAAALARRGGGTSFAPGSAHPASGRGSGLHPKQPPPCARGLALECVGEGAAGGVCEGVGGVDGGRGGGARKPPASWRTHGVEVAAPMREARERLSLGHLTHGTFQVNCISAG